MSGRLTDEQYAAIEAANPGARLARIPTAAGEIVIRAPTAVEESNFQQMFFGTSMILPVAWRNLLMMIAVHPDKVTLKSWLDTWTGIPLNPRVIRALKTIRGEADEEEQK
jgi:hypothetical protein